MKSFTEKNIFDTFVRYATGVSIIIFPVAQMIAFALHPQFLTFTRETSAVVQYDYIQEWGWQIGHVLVYVTLPLMLLAWTQIAKMVSRTRPWFAIVGGTCAWIGIGFMMGNFGSVMAQAAIGTHLPREQALPAIQLMLDNAGLMKLSVFGQAFALIGPMIILAGLIVSNSPIPRWAGVLALVGNIVIAVFIDIDGYMIWGALLVLIGLVPIAQSLLTGTYEGRGTTV